MALASHAIRVVKSAAKDVSVKVIVRVRPMLDHEVEEQMPCCTSISDDNTLEIERDSQSFQYKYANKNHMLGLLTS